MSEEILNEPTARLSGELNTPYNIEDDLTKDNIEVDLEDGSVVVDLTDYQDDIEYEVDPMTSEDEFYRNLAEDLDEDTLTYISEQVISSFEADKESRADWEQMFDRGIDLLGLKLEETTEPFEGAATAVHPLLIEAAVKFQSKASAELLPAGGPVKTQILGKQTTEKLDQANRVKNFMNYQVTTQMPEYFDETERMLFNLAIMGSAFKKIYYDAGLDRPVSEFVPLDQFYVSNFASNLTKADRVTQVLYRSPVDMERDIHSGMYAEVQLGDPTLPDLTDMGTKMNRVMGLEPSTDFDPQYTLIEQHCYLEIEEENEADGLLHLPYIVTIEYDSGSVLSIRRNYNEDDDLRRKKEFYTHYKYVPGFGFYGLGLIHFLGNLTLSSTAAMRSLLDAGQFSNLPAGFKAKGVRTVGDNDPISPGEFREVEAAGMDLSKSIVPLPYKEPSQTLYQMMQYVAGVGEKFADSTEQVINDSANYGPVGTTMALLDASGKFFSAIHKRLHNAQKKELQILARINYESLPEEYPYDLPDNAGNVLRKDFDGRIDVIPVTDPNIPSNAHRMMMANMALDLAQKSPPGMFNIEELHRTVLQSANMPNLERILPSKPQAVALDPVSDIVAAGKGIPIKAFAGQNHDAHIQVKMAYLQDPMNGANPIMQRLVPLLQANIQEHSILKWQEQMNGVEGQLSAGPLNDPNAREAAQAQAAQQVSIANQQAMQAGPSPEQQMIMNDTKRLELEGRKVDAQMAKEQAETLLADRKLDIEEAKLLVKAEADNVSTAVNIDQKEKDRESKELMNAINTIASLIQHEDKLDLESRKAAVDTLSKLTKSKGN